MADRQKGTQDKPASGQTRSYGHRKIAGRSVKTWLDVGVILLLVGLIAFAVYQCARHMTVGLNTLRTQEITDESYISMELYLFRDEQVLSSEGGQVCLHHVSDGEKVGVGASLGTAYRSDGDREALQHRLDAYNSRMALLRSIGSQGTPTDVRNTAHATNAYYLDLLRAADQGQLEAAFALSDRLLTSIERHRLLTGQSPDSGMSVSGLKNQQAALVSGLPSVAEVTTDRSGYFFYQADGYESVFDYRKAMTMTGEEFRHMTEQPASEIPEGLVGKMVYSPLWYAAAYVSLTDAAAFTVGQTYTMRCTNGSYVSIPMRVERMEPDSQGALLVFSSRSMPQGFGFERSFRAETVYLRVSGYRIPNEALIRKVSPETGETVTGVYILVGNVVEYRKIDVIVRRDGYIIARTYEDVRELLDSLDKDEYDRLTGDGWRYLRFNDRIITSGSELYEGKPIA